MSDAPDPQVIDYLREQFALRDAKLDRLCADVADVRERLDAMEGQVIGLSARSPDPAPLPAASPWAMPPRRELDPETK